MGYAKARAFRCQWCGVATVGNKQRRRKQQCVACAVARQGDSVRQLIAHSGPFYDRWAAATLAGIQRLTASPGPGECP